VDHRHPYDCHVHVTARSDYAIRAVCELAARLPKSVTRSELAEAQMIPGKFLESILGDLRRAGLLESQRGAAGGYRLARDPARIPLADIIRAIDGPLAAVRGMPPEEAEYHGAASHMREVWVAVRASMRAVLETTTVADVRDGALPAVVSDLTAKPESWSRR
jgi:Rrf2 family protein